MNFVPGYDKTSFQNEWTHYSVLVFDRKNLFYENYKSNPLWIHQPIKAVSAKRPPLPDDSAGHRRGDGRVPLDL